MPGATNRGHSSLDSNSQRLRDERGWGSATHQKPWARCWGLRLMEAADWRGNGNLLYSREVSAAQNG